MSKDLQQKSKECRGRVHGEKGTPSGVGGGRGLIIWIDTAAALVDNGISCYYRHAREIPMLFEETQIETAIFEWFGVDVIAGTPN